MSAAPPPKNLGATPGAPCPWPGRSDNGAAAVERRAPPLLQLRFADGCHALHYDGDDPTLVIALWACDLAAGRPLPAVILAVVPRVELTPGRVRVWLCPEREPSRAAARAIAAQLGLALCDETDGAGGSPR